MDKLSQRKFVATQILCCPKTCKFLFKYDYTYWSDTENYSSDFSSIRFINLNNNFISFYNTDSDILHIRKDGKKEIILLVR